MEIENTQNEQKPSIKLMKMSKGYQWEIKILSLDVEAIAKINSELEAKYGNIPTSI